MGDPQVTMGFNTKMVIHDLDDLGYSHDLGNFHMSKTANEAMTWG